MSPDGDYVTAMGQGPDFRPAIFWAHWKSQLMPLVDDSDDKEYPAWSNDGQSIIYLRHQQTRFLIERINPFTGATSSTALPTIECGFGFEFTGAPAESPDGTLAYLAWATDASGSCIRPRLYSIKRNGTGFRLLAVSGRDEALFSPSFSPDGNKVAIGVYTEHDPINRSVAISIRIMDLDGANAHDVGNVSTVEGPNSQHFRDGDVVCWSADGTRLLFPVLDQSGFYVYSVRSDGTEVTKISAGSLQSCSR
jgi:Tol biopolymer transport system component